MGNKIAVRHQELKIIKLNEYKSTSTDEFVSIYIKGIVENPLCRL